VAPIDLRCTQKQEIALQLGISLRTGELHKYTVIQQLKMKTTAELAAQGVRQQLVR
jgi:DNA-binding NarL/FixJ family response regulator